MQSNSSKLRGAAKKEYSKGLVNNNFACEDFSTIIGMDTATAAAAIPPNHRPLSSDNSDWQCVCGLASIVTGVLILMSVHLVQRNCGLQGLLRLFNSFTLCARTRIENITKET